MSYRALGERIQAAVLAPHKLRLQQVAAALVVLEYAQVQLHGQIERLVVERHQLAASIPEQLNTKHWKTVNHRRSIAS